MSGGLTLWLTGLSGAGKSTISEALKVALDKIYGKDVPSFIFDGDIIRKGLNKNLGFSKEDRSENIRRIAEVSKLFNIAGQVSIVCFISPYSDDRNLAKQLHVESNLKFLEIHVSTSLEVCENRDVKGLYKKARAGEIKNFTGISDPYEEPVQPDLKIDTNGRTVDDCVFEILNHIYKIGFLKDNRFVNFLPKSAFNGENLEIDEEEFNWLQCIQQGWVPDSIKSFMNEEQLLESLYFKTVDNKLQSLPIIFPINSATNSSLESHKGKSIKLSYAGKVVAEIHNLNTFTYNREELASKLFGTPTSNHPKTRQYLGKDFLVTGDSITFTDKLVFNDGLDHYRLSPQEILEEIKKKNADVVYAFQLRNPLHNGHVLLLNDTRKKLIDEGYKNPILLLHPCGGWTKDDDVPLKPRIEQHHAILENGGLNPETTILAIWPAPMFYAGPLEVLFHFSSRTLSNVDFMIVGRDPAGIKHPDDNTKDLFDPTHGAKVLQIASKKGLLNKTNVIPFKVAVYNRETQLMEYFDVKNKDKYENISGSKMRELARNNKDLPSGFMDTKGWEVLVNYYKSLN